MFSTMTLRRDNMRKAASRGFINATDCADYLTKKGVPFRDAYKTVGRLVNQCIKADETLETMTMRDFAAISNKFGDDVYDALDLRTCVAERKVIGGPAPQEVTRQIDKIDKFIAEVEDDEAKNLHRRQGRHDRSGRFMSVSAAATISSCCSSTRTSARTSRSAKSSSMQPTLRFCACRMRRHARPFRSSRTTRPALLTHRPRTAPTRIGTTALPSFQGAPRSHQEL